MPKKTFPTGLSQFIVNIVHTTFKFFAWGDSNCWRRKWMIFLIFRFYATKLGPPYPYYIHFIQITEWIIELYSNKQLFWNLRTICRGNGKLYHDKYLHLYSWFFMKSQITEDIFILLQFESTFKKSLKNIKPVFGLRILSERYYLWAV